jgi:hypothetical protein
MYMSPKYVNQYMVFALQSMVAHTYKSPLNM